MNVLVIGGTRGVGHAVVVAAHAAGHTLTVMARNAARFASPVSGIRMVIGDAADAADVERATAGQHAVVWTVGIAATRKDVRVFSHGTHHLLSAMRAHGVRRLICVTRGAAAEPAGRGAWLRASLMRPFLRQSVGEDQDRQEGQIRSSTLDWIIVRPAALTHGKGSGLYQALTTPTEERGKRIARADVAEFIVENLDAPEYVRKTVSLTG